MTTKKIEDAAPGEEGRNYYTIVAGKVTSGFWWNETGGGGTASFETITKPYHYDNVPKKTNVLYFPDVNISTVTREILGEDGLTYDTEIVKEGMTKEQLEQYFPARPQLIKQGITFNLSMIVRSIIYEAYKKEGTGLEEGNVRNFWYTHLKYTITKILRLGDTPSVDTTINNAWAQVINSGLVTYEGMNIIGGKDKSGRVSVVKDSPFNNIIIAVEKADYFERLKWVAPLFNCTLITAGGQPARTVARHFIKELSDLGVDLDQEFYMCVASDLDPAGYYIQNAFRKQFEAAIAYYGGCGTVDIKRLFVRKDQVTKALLENVASPCKDEARSEKAKKAEDTKWQYFCEQTDGGLYIEQDGKQVRALLEMNAFSKRTIQESIIIELLKIIEATSDESKIMIPEIMRVFELMRGEDGEPLCEHCQAEAEDILVCPVCSSTHITRTPDYDGEGETLECRHCKAHWRRGT